MADPCRDCSLDWRQLVSCRLDGELNEFETARLDRHLAVCAPCAAWAAEASSLAELLRSDERTGPDGTLALQVLRRRRPTRALRVAASAASVAAAAVVALALQLPARSGPAVAGHGQAPVAIVSCRWCVALPSFLQLDAPAPVSGPRERLNPVSSA